MVNKPAEKSAAAADLAARPASARPSLTLTRRLRARPEKVYAAWTKPENLVRWFGPGELKPGTTQAELDVRVGGRYRIRFTGMSANITGRRRLSRGGARRKTGVQLGLALDPARVRGGVDQTGRRRHGCSPSVTQFVDETARDNHRRGWSRSLGNLQQYVDA